MQGFLRLTDTINEWTDEQINIVILSFVLGYLPQNIYQMA